MLDKQSSKISVESIKSLVEQSLSSHPRRFSHIQQVAILAEKLALFYNQEVEDALIASYLHDVTKYYSKKQAIKLIEPYYSLDEIDLWEEWTLHALSASCFARTLGITNENIINAIKYHPTGRPNMSPLEQIIYISDYCEVSRSFDTSHILNIVYQSLDLACYMILKEKIEHIEQHQRTVMPISYQALEFYRNRSIGGNE